MFTVCYLNVKVEFSPTLKKLASMMDNIAVQLTACLSIFQRLPDLLTKKRSTKEVISSFLRFIATENCPDYERGSKQTKIIPVSFFSLCTWSLKKMMRRKRFKQVSKLACLLMLLIFSRTSAPGIGWLRLRVFFLAF